MQKIIFKICAFVLGSLLLFGSGYFFANSTGRKSDDSTLIARISELEGLLHTAQAGIENAKSLSDKLQQDNTELERSTSELRSENNRNKQFIAELENNNNGFTESNSRLDSIVVGLASLLDEVESRNTSGIKQP